MEIIDPTKAPDWDNLYLDHPAASIFHTFSWAKVLKKAYGYRPVYFVERGNGSVQTVIPMMQVDSLLTGRRGVSLPFSDYCEPLMADGAVLDERWGEMVKRGSGFKWRSLELRGGYLLSGHPSCQYLRHTINLAAGIEAIYKNVKYNVKKNIATSVKRGLAVEFSRSAEALEDFVSINCLTRKKHGLPPQPSSFFRSIWEDIISRGMGTIGLTRYKGSTVAAGLFLEFRNKVLFKYSGSNMAYQNLRPMNILYWRAIEWYCSRNYIELCLGRTDLDNEGLIRFKMGWSPSQSPLNYYRFDLVRNRFRKDKSRLVGLHNHVFRALPMPLLRLVGAILYRHMG